MAKKQTTRQGSADHSTELLKDLLIVELGNAGVPQRAIREIVGVDMNRVTRIMRHFKKQKKEKE